MAVAPSVYFDPLILDDLVDQLGPDGRDIIAGLISDFTAGYAPQVAKLTAALAAGDGKLSASVAHRLRGQCLQLGLTRLVEHLQILEQVSHAGDLAPGPDLLAAINRDGPASLAGLQAYG